MRCVAVPNFHAAQSISPLGARLAQYAPGFGSQRIGLSHRFLGFHFIHAPRLKVARPRYCSGNSPILCTLRLSGNRGSFALTVPFLFPFGAVAPSSSTWLATWQCASPVCLPILRPALLPFFFFSFGGGLCFLIASSRLVAVRPCLCRWFVLPDFARFEVCQGSFQLAVACLLILECSILPVSSTISWLRIMIPVLSSLLYTRLFSICSIAY